MKVILNKSALIDYMKEYDDDVYSLAKRIDVAPSTIYRVIKGERSVGSFLIPKLLQAFDLNEENFAELFIFDD